MSIELYLSQLTEDIRQAAQKASNQNADVLSDTNQSIEQHFQEVENYIYGPTSPLSKILGIKKNQLPPSEKLNIKQKAALYTEIEKLLNAFNFYPCFPEKLPIHLKYQVMRSRWDDQQVRMNCGQSHLEFCSYEPKECPFPAMYCACKNY